MQAACLFPSAGSCAKGTRRHSRMLLSVPMMVHHLVPGGVRFTHGISLDVSEGGVGALVEGSLQVGDTVELDLKLPDFELNVAGIVRHTSSLRSGFEFLGLTGEERQRIAGVVASA